MILVDSSGWIEYLANGDKAERYAHYLSRFKHVVTPTIVLYEVFKIIKSQFGKEYALEAAAQISETNLVPLSEPLACHAANISLDHKLSMADSIIYATAKIHQAKLITSDKDFKDLPEVVYVQ